MLSPTRSLVAIDGVSAASHEIAARWGLIGPSIIVEVDDHGLGRQRRA